MKKLIINADDYGLTESCTNATIDAFRQNRITSATICANGDYFDKAVQLIYVNKLDGCIGIHLNITEGTPLTDEIKKEKIFCNNDGNFHGRINKILPLTKVQKYKLYKELIAQIQKVRNSGLKITHADSHHHIHTSVNITSTVVEALKNSEIMKVRISRNIGQIFIIKKLLKYFYNRHHLMNKFVTTDYFGSISDFGFQKVLLNENKSIEIMVHPDYNSNSELIDRTTYDKNNKPNGNKLRINIQLDYLYSYDSL